MTKKIDGKAELNLDGGPLPKNHPLNGTVIVGGIANAFGKPRPRKPVEPRPEPAPRPDGVPFPAEAEGLYTSAEYRVLSHYLDDTPEYRELEDDLEEILDLGQWNTLDQAVVKIALERIEERLPNWMVKNNRGDWVESRPMEKPPKRRKVLLRPVFVGAREGFGAGPGMGWFCHYYATWIPLFNCFVVTESGDGGEDRVVGSFEASRGFDDEALAEIFEGDWISDDEWTRGPRFGLRQFS